MILVHPYTYYENLLVTGVVWALIASFVVFLGQLVLKRPRLKYLGMAGMGVGLALTIGALVVRTISSGHPPLSNLFESMVFLVFALFVAYFVAEILFKPPVFGLVAAPLIFVWIGLASILPPRLRAQAPLVPALQSYWLKIHVSLMLLSYGAFMISFAGAVLYLATYYYRERTMRLAASTAGELITAAAAVGAGGGTASEPGGASPAARQSLDHQLELYDELTYRMILFGFPVLALGIICGGVWANHAWGTYWSWDPKETWALITWLIYGAYLHMRVTRDWRGQKAAIMATIGFISVLITYLGVNYLAQGLHTYGSLL